MRTAGETQAQPARAGGAEGGAGGEADVGFVDEAQAEAGRVVDAVGGGEQREGALGEGETGGGPGRSGPRPALLLLFAAGGGSEIRRRSVYA